MRQVIYGDEARQKLLQGANKAADAIVSTMGPKGRTVIFEVGVGQPVATKDGVTVAKNVELEDKYENLGCNMIRQVSMKMNDDVGDGTTTVSCLARTLMNEAHKNVAAGNDPMEIRRDLEKGCKSVLEFLSELSQEVQTKEEIFKVASISANDKEIGEIIADVVDKTGKDGLITVEESQSLELTSEIIDGFEITAGYAAPHMINDESRTKAVFQDVPLLICAKKLESLTDLVTPDQTGILDQLVKSGVKQLVLLVDDINEEVMNTLIVNKMKGIFSSLVIKAPLYGEKRKDLLNDVAVLTGATIVSEETGISFSSLKLEHLGRVGRVISNKDKTAFIDGKGETEAIKERVSQLENQLEQAKDNFDKEKIKMRLAKLRSTVGVIKVGGVTEIELKEKKYRIDDALCATRAANEQGILPGGGVALLRAMSVLNDESVGTKILKKALVAPISTISKNAGYDPAVVIEKVVEGENNFGFNADSGEYSEDMLKDGIIDPTKVVKQSLENAVSIAIQFLSTDTVITEKPRENNEAHP